MNRPEWLDDLVNPDQPCSWLPGWTDDPELIRKWKAAALRPNPPHDGHIAACRRWPLKKLKHIVPPRMYERNLEHNQQVASCCRNTDNHMIEAWYSTPEEAARGTPDIYVITCTEEHPMSWDPMTDEWFHPRPNGERWHQIFMVGGTKHPDGTHEPRPVWEIR